MDNIDSLTELYTRLKPALDSKIRELNLLGYSYIKKEDLWNYLSKKSWSVASSLSLYNMVDDIFKVDVKDLNEYVLSILKSGNRTLEEMDVL